MPKVSAKPQPEKFNDYDEKEPLANYSEIRVKLGSTYWAVVIYADRVIEAYRKRCK